MSSDGETTGGCGATCPSGRCVEGAVLLGIVGQDGVLGYVRPQLTIDADFVERAARGRTPEARFRFAEPCAEQRCGHWAGDRCGLVDEVLESAQAAALASEPARPLPRCAIRRTCRWFAQRGPQACGTCPRVVHTPRTPPAAPGVAGA
jgi:hypothetical protein